MDSNIFNIVRDVLVVGYLFVIRVAVPLLILLMWGAALKKMLDKSPAEIRAANLLRQQEAGERASVNDAPSNPELVPHVD